MFYFQFYIILFYNTVQLFSRVKEIRNNYVPLHAVSKHVFIVEMILKVNTKIK